MFFGREDSIMQMSGLWRKRVSSLVTCRGRRRVGKSSLVRQFAKESQSRFIKFRPSQTSNKGSQNERKALPSHSLQKPSPQRKKSSKLAGLRR